MSLPPTFSIRAFLKSQAALLVHFNTPMSTNHPTGFPDDLRAAKSLCGAPISFSTIQIGDRGPWQGGHPAEANAGGSIGIVVDINDTGSVHTVDPGDSGSGLRIGSGGNSPDARSCADSISQRKSVNEWWVQDFTPLGVFIFEPAMVFVKDPSAQGERDADLAEVLREFPDDRIFSVTAGSFTEYDRGAAAWLPVAYDDIVPV